jgi:hypothetical protein
MIVGDLCTWPPIPKLYGEPSNHLEIFELLDEIEIFLIGQNMHKSKLSKDFQTSL